MFGRLWQWADKQDVQAATFLNADTKLWLLKQLAPPKPVGYIAIFPLPAALLGEGLEAVGTPDEQGMCWFLRTGEGIEEWVDPLPGRTLKPGAHRYDGRVTFFNDDGSCPDHTGRSGGMVERSFSIKYRSDVRLDDKVLAALVTKHVRYHAEEVRRAVEVATSQDANRLPSSYRRQYADAVSAKFAPIAIRCGDCIHPPAPAEEEDV